MEIDPAILNALILALIAFFGALSAWFAKETKNSVIAIATNGNTTKAGAVPLPIVIPVTIPVTDTRARDAAGNLTTTQIHGSQYWMDAGYTGPEPDAVTKAAFSDAQYAYDTAVLRAQALAILYGKDKLSPALKELIPA